MPKMKSHSGAKKRFIFTGKGKIRFKRAKMRHILEKRPKKMKRVARQAGTLCDSDARLVRRMLPNG